MTYTSAFPSGKIPLIPFPRALKMTAFGLLGSVLPTAFAPESAAAEIVRVIPEFRAEESFHRISEYFTGRENPGRRAILRSDPDIREGFYLKVRLRRTDRETFPEGTAILEVAMPDEQRTREYEYALDTVTRRRPLIMTGITGDDWPAELERPLAWKISFFDPDGDLLDSEQSFLWAMPDDEQE